MNIQPVFYATAFSKYSKAKLRNTAFRKGLRSFCRPCQTLDLTETAACGCSLDQEFLKILKKRY